VMTWTQMEPFDALVLTGAACLLLIGLVQWLTAKAVDRFWRHHR
jgi:hypothetical protein